MVLVWVYIVCFGFFFGLFVLMVKSLSLRFGLLALYLYFLRQFMFSFGLVWLSYIHRLKYLISGKYAVITFLQIHFLFYFFQYSLSNTAWSNYAYT